jgi:copper resistance protein C
MPHRPGFHIVEGPMMTKFGVAAALATVLCAGMALAHPQLDHAIPAVGSTVAAPREIRIFFTQPLISARSTIGVAADGGASIATSNSAVDTADPTQMVLRVPPLTPGKYLVRWHAIGIDGHEMNGDYPFEVGR